MSDWATYILYRTAINSPLADVMRSAGLLKDTKIHSILGMLFASCQTRPIRIDLPV